jgi:hypothetical protein
MSASPSGLNFPLTQSAGHSNPGALVDTVPGPRASGNGIKRPTERNTATEVLEPHWAAAIDAATD